MKESVLEYALNLNCIKNNRVLVGTILLKLHLS